ncbi:ABC transporter domain-containing protein [Haematococcus lacustris]|uniref:ABC transporter domain-containing protein n=1 Tax=Haematococcus lacustris TaxID=44745 RepID=A0A699ZU81_HAELA|nr:ABC transporter domain-containing protein [Haematococcus lacustris]
MYLPCSQYFGFPISAVLAWGSPWYSYINFARYAWGATMINQFEHNDIMYIGGMTVLEYFGFDGVRSKWTNVG